MADVSDGTANSGIFVDDIKTAIKAIKESKKRPNKKFNLAVNINEDYTGEILKDLVSKKILVNKRKVKDDLYEIMKVKKYENELFDTEPKINNECKTWSNYNFIVAELCSFSKSNDRTKTGQMDQKILWGM